MKKLSLAVLLLVCCSLLSYGVEAQGTAEKTRAGKLKEWTLELKAGWNWVSFPLLPSNGQVGNVLGTSGFSPNDLIQTSNEDARFTGSTWVPSTFTLDFGILYKIYVATDTVVKITGEASTLSWLDVKTGWNWIGNPTEKAVAPSELSYTAGFRAGDRIIGRGTNVSYNGSKWIPSSGVSLEPGRGYQFCLAKAGTLGFTGEEPDQKTYLWVDLSEGTDASSYPVHYSATGPDVTRDECRTTELWLRRIPAGTFDMGSPVEEPGRKESEKRHQVTLTEDYYIGVFECTQRQWELVMGNRPSYFKNDEHYSTRPVDCVSYNEIRGMGQTEGGGWPANGHKVDDASFLGNLQQKTGLVFDLPTEAQWEYACRKRAYGTCWSTSLNSGKNQTAAGSSANLGEVGRYYYNGGNGYYPNCTVNNGTAKVGSYQPSELGLYDMHGNAGEWMLDWYGSYDGDAENPAGAPSGEYRVLRGGCWLNEAPRCRAASRGSYKPYIKSSDNGFRLVFLPACSLAEGGSR